MTIAGLAVLAAALALALDRPLERVVPMVLAAAALLTYCTTLVGYKSAALAWIAGCAAVATVAAVLQLRTKQGELVKNIFRPGIAAFVLALAVAWPLVQGIRFGLLDDMLHWALFSKQMCGLEGFPAVEQLATSYGDYPPGVQMLLVFLQIGQQFSHPMLFWGQLLWYTGLALPLLEKTAEGGLLKRVISAVCGVGFLLLFPALFNYYYTVSLVVEPVMGLMLGCMVYTAWRSRQAPEMLDVCTVGLLACLLVVAKSTGILYAAAGLLAVAFLWRKPLVSRKLGVAMSLFVVLAAGAFWQSWQILCRQKGYLSYFTEDVPDAYTLQNLAVFLRGEGLAEQVIPNFCRALLLQPLAKQWGLSALGMLAVLWLLVCCLPRLRKQDLRPVLGWFTAVFLIYAVSLCYSYVYLFEEGEAQTLSAFSRYVGPLPTAALYLVLGAALWLYWGKGKRIVWCCAAAVFLFCVNWNAPNRWLPGGYENIYRQLMGATADETDDIIRECQTLQNSLENSERVLVITQTSSMDRKGQLMRYLMLPNQVEYWSPTECGDSHGLSLRWHQYLVEQEFEYVYCAMDGQPTADAEILTDQIGSPVKKGWLYQVHTESDAVQLEPVCGLS